MNKKGANSRASMAYVAFCVTLTCSAAATMTTTHFSHEHMAPAYAALSTPSTTPPAAAPSPQRYRFFARAYRFNRNNNRLANGGLHV